MPLVSEIGEFGLIERLRALDVVRGIGDDCAVMTPPPGHDLVMTADALIEGVHFRHEWISWLDLGYKSVAVNLSDIAAMGAKPTGLLVVLGLKPETKAGHVLEFYEGAKQLISRFDVPIIGGDIVGSPRATMVSITAVGEVAAGKAMPRGGAIPGESIYVTGWPGESAAGLRLLEMGCQDYPHLVQRHLRPTPRIAEAQKARPSWAVHAMIDLSDGLAGDLGHISQESGVGAILEESRIPVSRDLAAACERFGWDPLDLVLHGGEDYELLFTATNDHAAQLMMSLHSGRFQVTKIGQIVREPGMTLRKADGSVTLMEPKAFTHF